MKKPIAIISTDWHLNDNNAVQLLNIADEEVALAKKLDVNRIVWLGDMFDSRMSQRQDLLNCLDSIIDAHTSQGLRVHCIPGNHDKTDYKADESFLTPYRYHPGFQLYEQEEGLLFGNFAAYFVPFYQQDVWVKHFKNIQGIAHGDASILFSHTAIEGSINNDGSVVESTIKASMFKDFDRVFLGHYHNAQQPAKSVFHLPSVCQNNFGEDEEKGFTVLYDDLTFETVKSDFKPYRSITLAAGTVTRSDIKNAVEDAKSGNFYIRVVLTGTQEQVKGVDRKTLQAAGISVKVKYDDVEVTEPEQRAETVKELSGTDIKEKFVKFCEANSYSVEEGLSLLNETMGWKQE